MAKYPDYSAAADIFDAMRVETVDGVSVSDMVGGGHPMPLAAHFMTIMIDQADLARGDRILDIGCGCGRIAAALTQHLGPEGSYVGVDIIAGLVDFANRHIAPRCAQFSFLTLQRGNPIYDAWRHEGTSRTIASLEEACAAGTIDLCIATSLFTHLNTGMARETLRAIRRALAPDGRALISLFLVDAGVRALIRKGGAAFQFEHKYEDGVYIQEPAGPLGAVAFTFDHFVKLLTENDLYIERVLYGRWPGRPHHISGQDVIIVRSAPG